MAFTNLGEAKKIIEKIQDGYFVDKKRLLDGTGTTLSLWFEDIRKFAYKEPGNILDQVNEIGRLYAESLLTRTTGHKFNDYKNVYREFQSYLSTSRNDFYELFESTELARSDVETKKKTENIKERLKAFEKICEDRDARFAIDEFANILGLEGKDKRNFVSEMEKHANKINRSLKQIDKILENSTFSKIIDARLKNADNNELMNVAKKVVKENGIHIEPNKLVENIDKISNIRGFFEGVIGVPLGAVVGAGALIGGIALSGAILGGVPIICFIGFFLLCFAAIACMAIIVGFVGLGELAAWFTAHRLSMSLTVRYFKKMLNNLNKHTSIIFEEIGDMKRKTVQLVKSSSKTSVSQNPNNLYDEAFFKKFNDQVDKFTARTNQIWGNYATVESRKYVDFDQLKSDVQYGPRVASDKIGEAIEDLDKRILDKKAVVKRCDKICDEYRNKAYSLQEKRRNESDRNEKRQLTEQIQNAWKDYSDACRNFSYEDRLLYELQDNKRRLEERNDHLKKTAKKDGRHWSGIFYKKNEKTSSLGLAKQGLAITLCNIDYQDYNMKPYVHEKQD